MRRWYNQVLDELLEGEFKELKDRKDIYIKWGNRLPDFIETMNFYKRGPKGSILMWVFPSNFGIGGPINIYNGHYEVFKNNPKIFIGCLRHELLHLQTHLFDWDEEFEKLCREKTIPRAATDFKEKDWQV